MRNKTQISCTNEAATAQAAQSLATASKPGDIFLLEGDLGAGKTSFSRAFIRHLAEDADLTVPSPTFTLLQTYDTPKGTVWHFDLYRLKDPEEVYELGWDDALTSGIVLIEWPERLGELRPEKCIELEISTMPGNTNGRLITVSDKR